MRAILTHKPVAPFRLDLTAWTLRRRMDNIVDRWDGQTYRRVLALENCPTEVTVVQAGFPETPELEVRITGDGSIAQVEPLVLAALQRLLGMKIDLAEFYCFGDAQPVLKPLVQRFRGVKPPRFETTFEALVNAIACQQITLSLGIRLLNRLAENYGLCVEGETGKAYAFPRPQELSALEPEMLRSLGFSRQKGAAIIGLAREIVEKRLDLEKLDRLGDEQAIDFLQQLRGVGRWTAEYALLRGQGRLDIFPGDDVGARKHLRSWLKLPEPVDYQTVMKTLEPWKPYKGLIYFHLLLKRLEEEGTINPKVR